VTPRVPTHRYVDPLDRIWVTAARRIGLRVRRGPEAYASATGDGTLLLSDSSALDPDDSLAQLVMHELCHSLVEGATAFGVRDWGLDNETARDVPREEACLRVQAALAMRYGLRRLLAPTTDFRAFYDTLPSDPLAAGPDEEVTPARRAHERSGVAPFGPHLAAALRGTARIVESVRAAGGGVDGDADLYDA
jgi:hypothetical protein